MKNAFFILGKDWELSLAELSSFLVKADFKGKILDHSKNCAIVQFDSEKSIDELQYFQDILGGILKIGEIKCELPKKSMIEVRLNGTTISHDIIGRYGGADVLLRTASEGTGVIAAGPVRAVCDAVGIKDILTKCLRSNNPINVIKATVEGLKNLKHEEDETAAKEKENKDKEQ